MDSGRCSRLRDHRCVATVGEGIQDGLRSRIVLLGEVDDRGFLKDLFVAPAQRRVRLDDDVVDITKLF